MRAHGPAQTIKLIRSGLGFAIACLVHLVVSLDGFEIGRQIKGSPVQPERACRRDYLTFGEGSVSGSSSVFF